MATILETPRLTLREMHQGDLDFVAAMLADREVMRFYPRPLDREESAGWVQRQRDRYAEHRFGLWLAVDRASGQPVGQVGLTPPRGLPGADDLEIGYLIHRPFWRLGYASEAAAACRDHAFDVLGRLRVICLVRPVNVPSQGVARKIRLTQSPMRVEVIGLDHLVFEGERRAMLEG
jgi:RimJ/RimL family protein N-acetyltransferase